MALVPCVQCRQPFYASCHDGSCVNALCPYCEYADVALEQSMAAAIPDRDDRDHGWSTHAMARREGAAPGLKRAQG